MQVSLRPREGRYCYTVHKDHPERLKQFSNLRCSFPQVAQSTQTCQITHSRGDTLCLDPRLDLLTSLVCWLRSMGLHKCVSGIE